MSKMYEFSDISSSNHIRKLRSISKIPQIISKKKKNPLHKYFIGQIHQCKTVEILEQVATIQQIKQIHYPQKHQLECSLPPLEKICIDKIRNFAETLPVPSLLPDWEVAIRESVPRPVREKFSVIFDAQMEEIKQRYQEEMHKTSLKYILRFQADSDFIDVKDLPYKLPGKTENYEKYLRNRCTISRKYFLSHKLMRTIVAKAVTRLPPLICDFQKYREKGYLDFLEFVDIVKTDINKSSLKIVNSYYAEITKLITELFRTYQDVPVSRKVSFLSCASKLLELQIMNRIINSIEYFIFTMSQPFVAPLIKLILKCKNNDLFVSPLMHEIYSLFHSFLDRISQSANQLPSIESLVKLPNAKDFCEVKPPNWYIYESHQRLTNVLNIAFTSVVDYVDKVHERFRVAFDVQSQKMEVKRIVESSDFETCLLQFEEFDNSMAAVHGMPSNEYFSNFKLFQEDAKDGLKEYSNEVRKLIISELILRHSNYNLSICAEFEAIKKKALNIPQETKELLNLGRYMLHVSTKIIDDLRLKISFSLKMLASLFEMTSLNKAHLELNNVTVNWLQYIKEILEKNSTLYEQKKFELEDRLQTRIYNLVKRINNMFSK